MRAFIRRFHSPDGDLPLLSPRDPTNFAILIQMLIGPAIADGEESFDVLVCSPEWIALRARERGPVAGRHLLVVESFDFNSIAEFLRREVEALDEPSWEDLACKIGRLGRWEFEDYQP